MICPTLKMSTFHSLIQQEWHWEGGLWRKGNCTLATGSKEEPCRMPRPTKAPSVTGHRLHTHASALKGSENPQGWPNNTVTALGTGRRLGQAFFKRGGERSTRCGNNSQRSRIPIAKRFRCSLWLGKKSCTCLLHTRRPACSHWRFFLAAHSRLPQNYCLCFPAAKAGPGGYSNARSRSVLLSSSRNRG